MLIKSDIQYLHFCIFVKEFDFHSFVYVLHLSGLQTYQELSFVHIVNLRLQRQHQRIKDVNFFV